MLLAKKEKKEIDDGIIRNFTKIQIIYYKVLTYLSVNSYFLDEGCFDVYKGLLSMYYAGSLSLLALLICVCIYINYYYTDKHIAVALDIAIY